MTPVTDAEPRPPQDPQPADPYRDRDVIVARAGRYYRNARYLMAVICLGLGAWFAYDGWVGYPAENAKAREQGFETVPHNDLAVRLQKQLAAGLPLVGVGILAWMLYRSRGEYRLEAQTLHVPGHPPVPLDNVRQIDKSKWDRKGIVHLEYEVPGSTGLRRLTLDDFVYDQKPTDAILVRIEAVLLPGDNGSNGGTVEGGEGRGNQPAAAAGRGADGA